MVDHLVSSVSDVQGTIAINTDSSALADTCASTRLQIGAAQTDGFGTGGDAVVGRQAAEGEIEMLRSLFDDVKLVFLVVGLGGGTGTGGASVVLRAAHDVGAMTLCFATLPFKFEGERRRELAEDAMHDLRGTSDALIVVPNDRLFEFVGDMSVVETFQKSGQILSDSICALWKLIAQPGFINLDFADLQKAIQHGGGRCSLGYGVGVGENKAQKALSVLLSSPLLDKGNDMASARSLLISIVGGADLALKEVSDIMDAIHAKAPSDCHVSMGTVVDDAWQNRITIAAIVSEQWTILPSDEPASHSQEAPRTRRSVAKKRAGPAQTQTKLSLETSGRGRFKNVEPTILDGEDLDIPTFIRRGISIEK